MPTDGRMAYSCVRIHFEIGHEASVRNKRTPEGFTHDWEVFVRGLDSADIHHCIEKVVFHLHDTFPKPKRTVKEPPYSVKESGYAGFNLPIDVYFKSKDENRKVRYYYDLILQPSGPRISNVVREKAEFTNPSEDFRRKLIKSGGVGVGSDGGSSLSEKLNNSLINSSVGGGVGLSSGSIEEKKHSPLTSKPKVTTSVLEPNKKHKIKESVKPEEVKGSNSFADLFGPPIKTVKQSPTSSKPSSSSSTPKLATAETKSSHEKQGKESTKGLSKHSPHKERDTSKEGSGGKKDGGGEPRNREKERSKERDREKESKSSKDRLGKKSNSPAPLVVPPVVKVENKKLVVEEKKGEVSKKHREKKNRDEKGEKKHKEHHEKKTEVLVKEGKLKPTNKEEKKSKVVEKEKEKPQPAPPLPPPPEPEKPPRHKHKKKDKHKDHPPPEEKRKSVPEEKPPPPTIPPPPLVVVKPPKSPSPPPAKEVLPLPEKDSDSDFSLHNLEESSEMSSEAASSGSSKMTGLNKIVEEKLTTTPKEEKMRKKRSRDEEREARKRKKKREEPIKMSSPALAPSPSPPPNTLFTDDYVTQLKDLQQKIMTLQDNADLQRVVQVISETGQFEITQRTFDFDLCALDPTTVKRLQDMFIVAS